MYCLQWEIYVRTNFGDRSLPCCMRDPMVNHIELRRLKSLTSTSGSSLHGCGLSHSYGLNLWFTNKGV